MTESPTQKQTLRELIEWAVIAFNEAELCFAQGMPEPVDEAVFLALSILKKPLDIEPDFYDVQLTDDDKQKVIAVYHERIEKHRPAAYITNECWFAGLSFYVDERVLIPRSPFAELIQNHFSPWVNVDSVTNILDLCAGSGCIAIACAEYFDRSNVLAADLSKDALEVASINKERHNLGNRLQLVESDLFKNVPKRQYDIIVSNPPYVSIEEHDNLPEEFEHEPAMALKAGDDGMDLVIPILQSAREYMSENGILVVEVGYSQPNLEKRLPDIPFFWFEFEQGGEGVFMLSAQQLEEHHSAIMQA